MGYQAIREKYKKVGSVGLTMALCVALERASSIDDQITAMTKGGFLTDEFANDVKALAEALSQENTNSIIALIQRDVPLAAEHGTPDIPPIADGTVDVCPACESSLEFSDNDYSGDIQYYENGEFGRRWTCENCGAEGRAMYTARFTKHYIDKKGINDNG